MSLLSGWGRYPRVECRERLVRDANDAQIAAAEEPTLIARGAGRAYGDAALNRDCTLDLGPLDRMLDFDPVSGMLTCESGVLLADILSVFTPKGWFPPVTPGTKFVTVGGMLACDVHGKNHHVSGSFGMHVESFDLLRNGRVFTCSRIRNTELFHATRGGMGLTGIILRVSFRLFKIAGPYMRQQTIRAQNLTEVMQHFEESASWTYSVAWIDCLAKGDALGRAVLYRGEHARAEEAPATPAAPRRKLTLPFALPSITLNRWTVKAFNALYFMRAAAGERLLDLDRFFYPLDAIGNWNLFYGPRGFVQYQCVLPKAVSAEALRQLLTAIAAEGSGSFLATLKLFGAQEEGMLSFPMEGYSLALDFPATVRTFALLDRLDAIVANHGGRIYLAKDARTSPSRLRQFYPVLEKFSVWRDARCSSLLSQRLGL